ncbi:MAG: nucleotidyl transferase AbiEii/AbiGii toxin family protein [Clostridiales Family XIII bacterium]|jgi:hypothetical protein|nr:nucleotidyl transferase AbiEii/AbiGii toxin family protein [Clostridiales Family XIII bacterium]
MISDRTFSKDWLIEVNRSLGWNRSDAQLGNIEKAIVAMHLLECLSITEAKFVFKGGTSLLLLLGKIYRLSVDIDIVAEQVIDGAILERACTASKLFTRWEERKRSDASHNDMGHFMFYYPSFLDAGRESYVILDVYNATNPYASIVELELASDILCSYGENVTVRLPDIDSIIGDKLTAFAPETIGITLTAETNRRPKRVEAIKQLYDIGNLFDYSKNFDNLRSTYFEVANREIDMRGLSIEPIDVLDDTMRYATIIGYMGAVDKDKYDLIAKGFSDFRKFVADLRFDENDAVLAASKAAYLASSLIQMTEGIEKYDDNADIRLWEIKADGFAAFNELKYSNPEAFFYWFKTLE